VAFGQVGSRSSVWLLFRVSFFAAVADAASSGLKTFIIDAPSSAGSPKQSERQPERYSANEIGDVIGPVRFLPPWAASVPRASHSAGAQLAPRQ